jgi:hypothetical protein
MTRYPELLSEIEAFLARTGSSEFAFGFAAAKNGQLLPRIRSGRKIWPDTEMAVRAFLIANREMSTPIKVTRNPPKQRAAA